MTLFLEYMIDEDTFNEVNRKSPYEIPLLNGYLFNVILKLYPKQ